MSYLPAARVYTAARFSRQPEMREAAAWLRDQGFLCNPAWLGEAHDLPVDAAPDDPRGAAFASDDWYDLQQSEIVICFTEEPGAPVARGRGGRHVEMGLALAWGKRVIVVGHRENVFCWLPQVEFYPTWPGCQSALASEADELGGA